MKYGAVQWSGDGRVRGAVWPNTMDLGLSLWTTNRASLTRCIANNSAAADWRAARATNTRAHRQSWTSLQDERVLQQFLDRWTLGKKEKKKN